MPPSVEKGLYTRKAPWWLPDAETFGQRKDDAVVLADYVSSFEEARQLITPWNIYTTEVYVPGEDGVLHKVPGWQAISRDDTYSVLSLQMDSYAVISHEEFGDVIRAVVGQEKFKIETYLSLYGGKVIVCLVKFDTPLRIWKDDSLTFTYLAMLNRFDGRGGLKGIPTNMRTECANMTHAAELIGDLQKVTFTISHTMNWREKVEAAAEYVQMARAEGEKYTEIVNELAHKQVQARHMNTFIDNFYPIGTDMTDQVKENVEKQRSTYEDWYINRNLSIAGTAYGLFSAAVEMEDHYSKHRTTSSYVARTTLRANPRKALALKLARAM